MVSRSNHERLNIQAVGIFRSPFDRLRANGKMVKLMALRVRVEAIKINGFIA